MIRILSLGAGVQSTTMALMAAHGALSPMPDAAIFSDTGWEPKGVYEHLRWLASPNVLPFPVHIVSAGDIRADAIAKTNSTGQRFASIPWFVRSPKGKDGMGRRQCTKEYKLRPVQRKVVELLGGRPKGGAEVWIGISTDEAWRMKPSRVQYIVNRHVLIEAQVSRRQCFDWLEDRGYPVVRPQDATPERPQWPPKSSCEGCPFHDNDQWRQIMADPIRRVDRAIRVQPGMRGEQFMHPSRKPIDQVDFSTAEERGQLNLFLNECEGMCGV